MSGALGLGVDLRSQTSAFLSFCRLEKGLAANSISAYATDLERFCVFFGNAREIPDTEAIRRYLDSLTQAGLTNRTIGRHMATLRNFCGFLLREGRISSDPTEHLRTPRQWQTIPKYLNLQEIERIIQAPDCSRPNGLRDHAMMELLYATGLRVSELCKVSVSDLDLNYGVIRTTGKGNKQRLVPVGKSALKAVGAWLESGRAALLKGRASRYLFVTARGGCMTRQ
jgi:integrase/recombinase XerD